MKKKNENGIMQDSEKNKALANWTNTIFINAYNAKKPHADKWNDYLKAWNNDLFEERVRPEYATNHYSNFIFSSIESMRPILFDNNPRFDVIPATSEGIEYANQMGELLDYEWERTNMQEMLLANSVYTFCIGTSIIFLPYEYKNGKGNVDGDVKPIPVSPFNIFPDPLATSVDDAEYIIYATYENAQKLKNKYKKKANMITGGQITYSELVNNRDRNYTRQSEQVLVLEVWCRDWTTIDECYVDDDGNEIVNKKLKYPNGRVIISCPQIGVILEDKPNPYDSGKFPFFIFKDIDVPFQFWGEGEVKWLMSPQNQLNDLYNQIIDNAKNTANAQWVIDKNSGIAKGSITNRPGLIIRKNPGTDAHRESPPSMPMYVSEMVERLKGDIEVVSGIHDVTRGQTPSGLQSAAAIVALQEAAQTRIRLKVQLHENTLGLLGTEWLNRIKQFWKFNRLIPRKTNINDQITPMKRDGIEMVGTNYWNDEMPNYELFEVEPDKHLVHDYKVHVIGSSVLQRNKASMLDQLTRLAQTPAEDGMPMVPREAVLDYLPNLNKRLVLKHFQELKEEQQQKEQTEQANNQMLTMLQQLAQQVQSISQAVGVLEKDKEDREKQKNDEDMIMRGYEQGVSSAQMLQQQTDKLGGIPAELYNEIGQMDEDSISVMLQSHPELLEDSEMNTFDSSAFM